MKTLRYWAVAAISLCPLGGCQNNTTPDPPVGRNSPSEVKPYKAWVRVVSPAYFSTDVLATKHITLGLVSAGDGVTWEQAQKAAYEDTVIESYPSRKRVEGRWQIKWDRFIFVPNKDLAAGDYLIRFPTAGNELKVTPHPYSLFRVGSGPPRLAHVHLTPDPADPQKSPDLKLVELLIYGQKPSHPSPTIVLEKKVSGTWQTLALRADGATKSRLANDIDSLPKSGPVRVTVHSTSLDGAISGVAGSRNPVTYEFRIEEHSVGGAVQYTVPLDLTGP